MPTIRETIITTIAADGRAHIAPFGLIAEGEDWIIAPFRPSTTLDNLRAVPWLVANYVDDVRIFAGCLTGRRETGRREFACVPTAPGQPPRLAAALAHATMQVVAVDDDAQRPRFTCRVRGLHTHAPFRGFSRAQGAVVEAAILVSRLSMLPREKVEREIAYLAIAIEKTAGDHEREAWSWLMQAVADHYAK